MPSLPAPPGATASVGELLRSAGVLFRVTVMRAAPVAMVATLAAEVPNFYLLSTGWKLENGLSDDPRYWLLVTVMWLADVMLFGLITLQQMAMLRGQPAAWPQLVARMLRAWPRLAVTLILAGLAMTLGVFLLVVPAIYLAFCFMPLQPLALSEEIAPLAALRRCERLVRPIWAKVVAITLVAFLIVLMFLLVGGIVIGVFGEMLKLVAPALVDPASNTLTMLLLAVAMVYFSALALLIYTSASSSA